MCRLKYSIKILAAAALIMSPAATAFAAETAPHDGASYPLSSLSSLSSPLTWRIGARVSGGFVPGTDGYLRGANSKGKNIEASMAGGLRGEFSFSPDSRPGILYCDTYQGLGVEVNSFFANSLLGTPVSAYVYQGAPIVRFGDRLWLGYEWQFGAACGWKKYNEETNPDNAVVSSDVTAHMAVALKLNYEVSPKWRLSFGIEGRHFSNGNTSWPNAGVNTLGASVGLSYMLGGKNVDAPSAETSAALKAEADRGRWIYDIVAFGAWRKRVVDLSGEQDRQLCPGKFAVAGIQFSPMRTLNRWVAVGPALDMQWDESADLAPNWIEGTSGDLIRFVRPGFGKQLSVGVSAHAELTMPIFSVNVGLGVNILNPEGDRRFYQMLNLKTFVTRRLFLNVGYRLGKFKDAQNLARGVGVRL